MSVTGALCGYVCVPHGHPFRGKDYDALPEDVEVHGGITYARERVDLTGTTYWFGFDCAHAWDLCPAMVAFTRNMRGDSYVPIGDDVYRDWAYVRENVLALARSLKSHEKDPP